MLRGTITALVTPLIEGELDLLGLEKNVKFQIENGVSGVLPLGTTGEAPTLDRDEKIKIIKSVVNVAKSRTHIMVGTGTNDTKETIEDTRIAEDLGADSCLIVTPYYNKPTQTGIIKHFEAIANSTKLPITVYNIPGRSVVNIETETMLRIAEIDNVIAIKESSGNINQIIEVIQSIQSDRISILSGDDSLAFQAIAFGARGLVSVVSNLVPDLITKMVNFALNNDFQSAKELHFKLMPLFKAAFIESNPSPIKTAMNINGFPAGDCRLPLCELLPENLEKLKSVLNSMGLVK